MESVILKRGIGIFSIIAVVIIASVACNALAGGDDDPEISNPDETYMSFDGIEITNEMIYNRIRSRDGIKHLANTLDQQLLSDYIDAVTQEDIDAEMNRLKYGTNDADEIERLTEGEKEEMELDFNDRILLEGYNPEDTGSVENFMRLYIAQMDYTHERYTTTDPQDPDYINENDLESFYNDFLQGDATIIPLRFYNEEEMRSVFNHFDIIEDVDGGFARYTGEEPIEDVETFDEDNTDALSDDEVREVFIDMYNYLNQHTDAIDTSLDDDALLDAGIDAFNFNQYDLQMLGERRGDEFYDTLSQMLWGDLRDSETPYTTEPQALQNEIAFFYAADFEDVDDFAAMDDDSMREQYVETMIGEEQMQQAMFDLHDEVGLRIHDSKLATKYEMQTQRDLYESHDDDIIASAGDVTISADDFFEYATSRVGALYSTDLSKVEYLFDSEHFEYHYGSNQDVFNNGSELMQQHRNDLRTEKNWFANDVFGQLGISTENYTWNEYLFIFGETVQMRPQLLQMMGIPQDPLARYSFDPSDSFHSERDFLRQMVERTIRYDMIDANIDYAEFMDRVEHNHDNYFSLDTQHLLIYVDFDNDFVPDDFHDYYDGLSSDSQDELDELHEELHAKLSELLEDEDNDFDDLVEEYMTAMRGEDEEDEDYSKWAKYRNAGLRIMYEDLSQAQENPQQPDQNGGREPLTYQNTQNYDDAFVESLQSIYTAYTQDTEAPYMTNDSMAQSQFGLHFIKGVLPEGHIQPSAAHDSDSDDYQEALHNESDVPNVEQLEAYTQNVLAQFAGEAPEYTIPQNVQQALDTYYQPLFNSLFSDGHYSMIMSTIMQDNDVTFAQSHDHQIERLESLNEFYNRRLFPDLD